MRRQKMSNRDMRYSKRCVSRRTKKCYRTTSQTDNTVVEIRVMLYSVAVCEAIRAMEDAMDQKKQFDRVSYEERAREIQYCLLASQDSLT